eukprot:TRINITY_DN717_c2_g1_i1.p1 TRINITY_DN717_c2_g1~~TRINITY_DN717_c2_g1_i1.p1  ORF type:complete len:1200 (-),score=468.87 TRINITY_DN717_c2_g1_i1:99-3698(-)
MSVVSRRRKVKVKATVVLEFKRAFQLPSKSNDNHVFVAWRRGAKKDNSGETDPITVTKRVALMNQVVECPCTLIFDQKTQKVEEKSIALSLKQKSPGGEKKATTLGSIRQDLSSYSVHGTNQLLSLPLSKKSNGPSIEMLVITNWLRFGKNRIVTDEEAKEMGDGSCTKLTISGKTFFIEKKASATGGDGGGGGGGDDDDDSELDMSETDMSEFSDFSEAVGGTGDKTEDDLSDDEDNGSDPFADDDGNGGNGKKRKKEKEKEKKEKKEKEKGEKVSRRRSMQLFKRTSSKNLKVNDGAKGDESVLELMRLRALDEQQKHDLESMQKLADLAQSNARILTKELREQKEIEQTLNDELKTARAKLAAVEGASKGVVEELTQAREEVVKLKDQIDEKGVEAALEGANDDELRSELAKMRQAAREFSRDEDKVKADRIAMEARVKELKDEIRQIIESQKESREQHETTRQRALAADEQKSALLADQSRTKEDMERLRRQVDDSIATSKRLEDEMVTLREKLKVAEASTSGKKFKKEKKGKTTSISSEELGELQERTKVAEQEAKKLKANMDITLGASKARLANEIETRVALEGSNETLRVEIEELQHLLEEKKKSEKKARKRSSRRSRDSGGGEENILRLSLGDGDGSPQSADEAVKAAMRYEEAKHERLQGEWKSAKKALDKEIAALEKRAQKAEAEVIELSLGGDGGGGGGDGGEANRGVDDNANERAMLSDKKVQEYRKKRKADKSKMKDLQERIDMLTSELTDRDLEMSEMRAVMSSQKSTNTDDNSIGNGKAGGGDDDLADDDDQEEKLREAIQSMRRDQKLQDVKQKVADVDEELSEYIFLHKTIMSADPLPATAKAMKRSGANVGNEVVSMLLSNKAFATPPRRRLLLRVVDCIDSCYKQAGHDVHTLAWWLSATTTLQHELYKERDLSMNEDPFQNGIKVPDERSSAEEAGLDDRKSALHDFDTSLCHLSHRISARLVAGVGKLLDPFLFPAVIAQDHRLSEDDSGHYRHTMKSTDDIGDILQDYIAVIQDHSISPIITNQLSHQVFHYVGAKLFNDLLHRPELCTAHNAFQIKLAVAGISGWVHEHADIIPRSVLDRLGCLDQASNCLTMLRNTQTFATAEAIRSTFPALNIIQVRHLLENFTPDKLEKDVPRDVMSVVEELCFHRPTSVSMSLYLDPHRHLPRSTLNLGSDT